MSFDARVFRILIASPSDVEEEREIAVRTIQAWNDLNSSERQIVLLPLRWETHSAPEYGKRPQEVINRQVVDHSDLLVGIFWTRVGSPTGVADSGTLEEIERVAGQGKMVMLYFSQVKQDPDRIDPDQLRRLREFKTKSFPKALIESYASTIEFRDKLAKQLEIQLRTLVAEESQGESGVVKVSPTTEVQFEFADPVSGSRLGRELQIQSTVIEVEDVEAIPDYGGEETAKEQKSERENASSTYDLVLHSIRENKNYYRETVAYLVRSNFFHTLRFWLKNTGGVGARDVYVDIRITSDGGDTLSAKSLREARLSPPSTAGGLVYTGWSSDDAEKPEQLGNQWSANFEIQALQPQREVSPPPSIVIGTQKTAVVSITAKIYADTLSEPVTRTLQIRWQASIIRKKALALLEEAGIAIDHQGKKARRKPAAE